MQNDTAVRYASLPGQPAYRVSSEGVAETCLKHVGFGPRVLGNEWRPLKPDTDKYGYKIVVFCHGGKRVVKKLHRFVLEAFVGPCPAGMLCRHLDGNPANNRLDNLEWGTDSQNYSDRVKHGTDLRGEKNGRAKLQAADVIAIREMAREGKANRTEIAKQYGTTPAAISHIITGRNWRFLPTTAAM